MTRRLARRLGALLALALGAAPAAADEEPVRIGWTPWADGVFVTRLAERLLTEELEHRVELIEAPISEQYQGIADGRIDVMLMSWQPHTHAPYLERLGNRVEHLGVLYDGARLGWAVPEYVPREEVATISDLAAHAGRFDGRITGIDPDAGLTRLSDDALARYELDDFELTTSSGPEMAAELEAATAEEAWIVVTAWNPHWIFAAHELRYLDDPEGVLGGSERVQAVARSGFYADHPEAARLLARMYLDLDALERALLEAQREGYEAAIDWYLDAQADEVAHWLDEPLPE